MLYFRCQQLVGVGVGADICPKADEPPLLATSGARVFIDRSGQGGGLPAETVASALTVIFKLVISGLTSIILIVLGTVNLQFQSPFVPVSLQSVLGTVAAHVLRTIWSAHS